MLAWVEQYRPHPAVRMWAVGNEVLQRSVPPAWCGTAPSASQSAWADAWSSLLVEVADLIHARDPDHPVLYREAEDSYAPWLARALAANPADRPWLVYGVNAYTPRLAEILDGWPERGIPTSLLVSEYAPLNAPHGERADQFREIWGVIQARSSFVLGGAVYVWSTDGPEEVDRAFGLVDAERHPGRRRARHDLDALPCRCSPERRDRPAQESGCMTCRLAAARHGGSFRLSCWPYW